MKRSILVVFTILMLILLSACGPDLVRTSAGPDVRDGADRQPAASQMGAVQTVGSQQGIGQPGASRQGAGDLAAGELTAGQPGVGLPVDLSKLKASSFLLTDMTSGVTTPVDYSDPMLVSEFISFLKGQKYAAAQEEWDKSYKAELLDEKKQLLLSVTTGARAVTFDRDVSIGGKVYHGGVTYETDRWIYNEMQMFSGGRVLNPSAAAYPAQVTVPTAECTFVMSDCGNEKINLYDTLPRLDEFAKKYIIGQRLDITSAERYLDTTSMDEAAKRIDEKERCIHIQFGDSETYMEIADQNDGKYFLKAYPLTIGRSGNSPGRYDLLTDGMVLHIKVGEDFDRAFQALFDNDAKTEVRLTPEDIKRLFKEKKPFFLDYICRNLGLEGWNGREDDKLETKRLALDGGKPCTVLELSNDYNTRLLIFDGNDGGTSRFVDSIDFGGRSIIPVDLHTVTRAGVTWIVGNSCKGYGTGVASYYQDWYAVSDKGKKLVLSFPKDDWEQPPWGGYHITADKINVTGKNSAHVIVDFSVTRQYLLDIDIADEYGYVGASGKIRVEFAWDPAIQGFISSCKLDDAGESIIPAVTADITKECDRLLHKYYDRLEALIKSPGGSKGAFEREFKARGMKGFLDDCSEGEKKAALYKQLYGYYPEYCEN